MCVTFRNIRTELAIVSSIIINCNHLWWHFYCLIKLHTKWSRVKILEETKCKYNHCTGSFILHLSLSSLTLLPQSTFWHKTMHFSLTKARSSTPNLMLSSYIFLSLRNGSFSKRFPNQNSVRIATSVHPSLFTSLSHYPDTTKWLAYDTGILIVTYVQQKSVCC
jgi:hypothetical protein